MSRILVQDSTSLNEVSAKVDKSDFAGLAKFEFRKRPKITIRLKSSVIDFTALMKSLEQDEKKTANKDPQKGRLFSDDPLPFDVLEKVDADIVLKARNIHAKDARLKFGHMTLKLEDSDFSIKKFEATYKQTKISGDLHTNHGSPTRVATKFLVFFVCGSGEGSNSGSIKVSSTITDLITWNNINRR